MPILGDLDFSPLTDVLERFELLPNAQLAVLPGTTHVGVARRASEVFALITRPSTPPERLRITFQGEGFGTLRVVLVVHGAQELVVHAPRKAPAISASAVVTVRNGQSKAK